MSARPLLLVGAGGFAREVAAAVEAINAVAPTWDLLGFCDDDPALHGSVRVGYPVLGAVETVHEHPDAAVVLCTGNPRLYWSRWELAARLGLPPERYATVVHPQAALGAHGEIGPGSVLLAGVVSTASVRVGAHVAVMPQTVLTHDCVVADHATLAAGVRLGGGVRLDRGAYLGSGVLVREAVRVGAWAMLGMGALVLSDVPAAEVWVGAPAHRLRAADVPEHLSVQRVSDRDLSHDPHRQESPS